MSDSPHTCSGCLAVVTALSADGLCETCHVATGETPRGTPRTVFPIPSAITDPLATKEFPANFEDRPTFPYDANEKTSEKKERLPANPPGYELIERIGSGGMAVVYRAIQQGTQRDCAIKYVDRFLHVMSVARLEREVRAMATLDHPNVLKVFACHFGETFPNFVMEFAAGGSLAERVKKAKTGLPIGEAVALTETVARTMAFAHEKGLIHRDLKPSNLLLDTMGTLKVADFGLARNLDTDPTITKTDAIVGTPCFMSPEQAAGKEATRSSDIYGIGAILYDLLTGLPPFPSRDHHKTLNAVIHDLPIPPRGFRRDIPPELEAICLKALEKEPTKRYATSADMADDLTRFRKGESTLARPLSLTSKLWRKTKRNSRWLATAATILAAIAIAAAVWPNRNLDQATQKKIASRSIRGINVFE